MTLPQVDSQDRVSDWAIASVRTGREIEVSLLLAHKGRRACCPIVTTYQRKRGQRAPRPLQTAAMKGYLLIEEPIGDPDELDALEGFHGLLRYPDSGRLKTLTGEQVDWIMKHLSHEEKPNGKPLKVFKVGDTVRVSTKDEWETVNPFEGMKGKVLATRGQKVWLGGMDFPKPVLFPVLYLSGEWV